nr:prolyl oligopeptidase family serine peptidase [Mangrovihabitans endophyticus]
MDFPDLARRTAGFRNGAPYGVTVGADGARVVFLRSAGPYAASPDLWVLDVASGTERRVGGPAPDYGIDRDATVATWSHDGRLHRADLLSGRVAEVPTDGRTTDPQPSPDGTHLGYLTADGCLRVIGPHGDELLAGEPGGASWRDPGGVRWGSAGEPADLFGRARGWWWSPDGGQILACRLARAVSLHLLDLDGGWVDVHWDRETYPHLADVRWDDIGPPLITVLRRMQQHGLVLAIDPRTGETQVHAELADARWVEPVPGTPRQLADGRVLVGGELAHDGFDARCLFADGSLITPPGLYVRRVIGAHSRTGTPAGSPDLIVAGTDGEPSMQHIFRVRTGASGAGAEATPVTTEPGWHTAAVGGDVLVVDDRVWRGGTAVGALTSHAAPLPYRPAPVLDRVTDRRLPAGVLYPTDWVSGTRLPVLLTFGAGPGHQQVIADPAAWQERQWFAQAGFAVVSVDSRGTPGVAPSFEKAVHRRLADVTLADHRDALHALWGKHPDLDLDRVAARGVGLGGWLAALAVHRHAGLVRCAVARDPITDWGHTPTAYAERYLGRLADAPDVYAHHSLTDEPDTPDLLVVDRAFGLHQELDFIRRTIGMEHP